MKKYSIAILETAVAAIFVAAGLTETKILFIQSPRSAVIALGLVGMLLCTEGIYKFAPRAAAHPLTIAGYILGALMLFTYITQIFSWQIPVLGDEKLALIIIGAGISIKSFISRFDYLLPEKKAPDSEAAAVQSGQIQE